MKLNFDSSHNRFAFFFALSATLFILFSPRAAQAQFDRLLKDLQKALPQQGSPSAPTGSPNTFGRSDQQRSGLSLCDNQVVARTSRSQAEVDKLILSQFRVSGEQFFNDAYAGLVVKPRSSAAIPSLNDFVGTFETQRGNRLFSTLLAWPEPEVVAEVIAETQNKRDPQLANDASVMLIFLHWAVPSLSRQEQAWLAQANDFRVSDPNNQKAHITACFLWARLYATGEAGRVMHGEALGQFNTCGQIDQAYRESNGQKAIDPQNYYQMTLNPSTFNIITKANPRALSQMGPFAQNLKNLADSVDKEQDSFRKQFVSTPPGRTAIASSLLVSRAEEVGAKAIRSSQQLSRSYGDLQANLKQVDSGQGAREGEFIPSLTAQARLALMANAAKNSQVSDLEALNEVRQLQGAAAVGLTQARNSVEREMFSSMQRGGSGGGLLGAARVVKVLYDLDAASIRSCLAYNSFAQAARARNVSTVDDEKATSSFMADMMKSN